MSEANPFFILNSLFLTSALDQMRPEGHKKGLGFMSVFPQVFLIPLLNKKRNFT